MTLQKKSSYKHMNYSQSRVCYVVQVFYSLRMTVAFEVKS